MSRFTVVILALLIGQNAWLLYPRVRALLLTYQESPAARGHEVAMRLGCFSCHGPGGKGGVPNPGSRWETVPGFSEQTLMMFVSNDGDLREYILDGAPVRKRDDTTYRAQLEAQALHMPAFRGWIGDGEVDALVAFLRSSSGMLAPPTGPAARGAALARSHGCFSCHGEMGTGGHSNPGSLKGYIPGFFGDDFTDLVRGQDELLAWIRDGKIERIGHNVVGSFFFERQRIQMPAFRKFLTEAEIEDLAAYVRWLAEGSWHTAPLQG